MARLALVFIAVFFFVQFALADTRDKRDAETTTENILDSIKNGITNALSEENIKKAVDNLNQFGDTLKSMGDKVVANIQNAMKKEDTTAAP